MFGFGRGKVELKLEKMAFAPGDVIKGQLVMNLKKPLKAKKAYVRLYAEVGTTQMTGRGTSSTTQKIYDFTQELDKEKEYPAGEKTYDFEIAIPKESISTAGALQGKAGTAVKAASLLMGRMQNIKWVLKGGLDTFGFDFAKTMQLSIS